MPIPETYKTAVLPSSGAGHTIEDHSLSALQPDEVAIKVTATAINPIDWKMRDTGVFIPSYPAVLGSDAAGEIADTGSGVSGGLAVGDRVFFQGILGTGESTTFQQYCKMPAALVSKTPGSISDDQAAGIVLATMAAAVGLYDTTGYGLPAPWDDGGDKAGAGQAVAIIGGSSSVGQYAIQFARLSGFTRIITNASPGHVDHLKGLGAHVVLDRATQSQPEDFLAAAGGLPLAHVIDCIAARSTLLLGIQILQKLAAAAGDAGRAAASGTSTATLVRIAGEKNDLLSLVADRFGGGVIEPEVAEASQGAGVTLKGILGVGSAPHLRYLSEPLARHLGGEDGYVARGLFVPNRPVVVQGGLKAIDEALDKNKKGVSGEKVVIRPFE